jgi:hypothetical protein
VLKERDFQLFQIQAGVTLEPLYQCEKNFK